MSDSIQGIKIQFLGAAGTVTGSKYLINNSFEYNLRLRTLFDYNNYIKKLVNIYSEILNI